VTTGQSSAAPVKPRLRGVLHQWGAVATAIAGIALVVLVGKTPRAMWSLALFAFSHAAQMAVSALYHRITWSTETRARMRRADHAAVFLLIAGSATPFAVLSMPPGPGSLLLWTFWGGAAVGIGITLLWPAKPKWLMPVLCVGLGWAGASIWLSARASLDTTTTALIIASGTIYSVGALCYALKRPRLLPTVFGYHELFHALTLVAAVINFMAVIRVATE
jgi:hemolysin III